ncbi:DUF4190 domain-containing protein [Micromonospora peucetia]|uniref:DUF4190 domain-containing protein n=1 Tax=Micromonospora peucetia TaxID=47871 RepID=A0A1C6UJL8_9ACTN|nr:DUF4190 domain-containing protein [Micromonospora peucetia]MCX4386867.1 DUF4190 domain-containing protein [Micromonospora peucetia]WSA34183.1 DUF4190 domain-containing protein [Micromonospora peucetia]SCL54171.1 protein of unknown function (DUF4190) [Micromonospora peucetia]
MTYPPPSGGWNDPAWSGQQSSPPADPALPVSGQPIPTQPTGPDPYAPADPYAGGDPYAGMKQAPGQPAPAAYPPPGYPGYPGYGYAQPPKTNGMAIAALVLALVGIGSCITAPVGAILGHVAQKQIRQTGEGGEGMAKAAIIVGWILTGLLVLVILFYVAIIVFAITQAETSSTSY